MNKTMTPDNKAQGRYDKRDFVCLAQENAYRCPAGRSRLTVTPRLKMKHRRCTVEHVFGTLKFWMGSTHFLMKRLEHVGTEMSLHALPYNFRRVINILGIDEMMKAIRLVAA